MCMKENLIHYRTSVCNINYHVVWSVKYRRKVLTAEVEAYLKELVQCYYSQAVRNTFISPACYAVRRCYAAESLFHVFCPASIVG